MSTKIKHRGRSAAEMKAMRRKYGLGEFKGRGARRSKKGVSGLEIGVGPRL